MKDRAEGSNRSTSCAHAREREVEPLHVGVLGGDGDVEVGSRTPPAVHLRRDAAHDHELDALPGERPQQLGLVGGQPAHA